MSKKNKNPWESLGISKRRTELRTVIDTFLIVCEGEKTEPNYFEKFPVKKDIISLDIQGKGMNTLSLVEEAIKIRDDGIKIKKRYNQVWVVFDKDSFSDDDFDNAIKKANVNQIKVAYSNEAFELWFILHYEFMNSGISRKQYSKKLTKHLAKRYKKNSEDMYDILKDKQEKAIQNSHRLMNEQFDISPSKANPSTTVFKLVKELNRFIECS